MCRITGKNKGTGYFTDHASLNNPIPPPSLLNFPLHLLADLHPGRPVAQTGTIALIAAYATSRRIKRICPVIFPRATAGAGWAEVLAGLLAGLMYKEIARRVWITIILMTDHYVEQDKRRSVEALGTRPVA